MLELFSLMRNTEPVIANIPYKLKDNISWSFSDQIDMEKLDSSEDKSDFQWNNKPS